MPVHWKWFQSGSERRRESRNVTTTRRLVSPSSQRPDFWPLDLRGPSNWRATCSRMGVCRIHRHFCDTAKIVAGDNTTPLQRHYRKIPRDNPPPMFSTIRYFFVSPNIFKR
ncbi:unnamed protein product [Ixodes pacificus]